MHVSQDIQRLLQRGAGLTKVRVSTAAEFTKCEQWLFACLLSPERHHETKTSITGFLVQAGAPLKPITDNALQSMWAHRK